MGVFQQWIHMVSHVQHASNDTSANSNGAMPLTPPGSPDDEEESQLIICDSPQKTPQKPQFAQNAATPHLGNATGQLISALALSDTDHSRTDQFQHGAMVNSVTARVISATPMDLDASLQLANLFYNGANTPAAARSPSIVISGKRGRPDKKPIPSELKDDKYFERRRRNNEAAKKSRDSRKNREDEIAARAAYLEQENAVLRTQVATLREEAENLRLLLLQKQDRQLVQAMMAPGSSYQMS